MQEADEIIDEEGLLLRELIDIRNRVEIHKKDDQMRMLEKRQLEKRLEEAQQAMIDYMSGNGLKQYESGNHRVTLGYTTSVDIIDVNAVPDDYCRIKTIKEPNKILIGELIKSGGLGYSNYASLKTNPKITITLK